MRCSPTNPDLFSIWRVVTSEAGHLVLLCDDRVMAQGDMRTIALNPGYRFTKNARFSSSDRPETAG